MLIFNSSIIDDKILAIDSALRQNVNTKHLRTDTWMQKESGKPTRKWGELSDRRENPSACLDVKRVCWLVGMSLTSNYSIYDFLRNTGYTTDYIQTNGRLLS
jgi:hypothetical protein